MKIHVELGKNGYDIELFRGALADIASLIPLSRKVLVVTDDGVPSEYADKVVSSCLCPVKAVIPQGEESKCFEKLQYLLSLMLSHGFTRHDAVVAVGGGVVGDLSGFAASIYMRGIDFYNIPTTLLSQVDSSVGGKTAVDFMGVKNVIGTFYQ
ncbi:MAG: 3-dehydroquinate synthase, partial [Eubacteriales bacterium]